MVAPLGTVDSDPVSVEDDEAGLGVAARFAAAAGPAGLAGPSQSAEMNSVPVTRWIHECWRALLSSFTRLRLSSATDAHPPDR